MFLGGLAGDSAGFDGVSCKVLDSAEPMNAVQSQQSIHVLLVDDDTLARHVVRKALEKFGYQVTVVVSAHEALQVLESTDTGTFQLILSDVVMPDGGDGLHLLENVKSNAAWTTIPVVMMSANECVDTVRECLQHGACHYIVKPATHKEIKNIWQYAFRGSTVSISPDLSNSCKQDSSIPTTRPVLPLHQPYSTTVAAAPSASTSHNSHSAVNPTAPPRLLPNPLASTNTNCPLNTVLESTYLPWSTRLTIFCHLLNTTLKSFQHSTHTSTASPNMPPALQQPGTHPFTSPASVLVSSSGEVSTCSAPSSHHSTPFYSAPAGVPAQHRTPQTGGKPYDSAQATYALGVLLMELAMAPVAATDRSKHLAALPRLPVQLLSSKPNIAVLVLQMTAEHPQDRLQLAQVAAEASIAEMYSIVATEDTAEVAAAAAGRAQLRRAFLVRAEGAQRAHVTAVSEDLCRIEQDFKQIEQALRQLETPSASDPAAPHGASAQNKCVKTAHAISSSQQQRLPAAVFEWPARGSCSTDPVAMVAQPHNGAVQHPCGAANACESKQEQHSLNAQLAAAAEAAGSGSDEGSNQQPNSGVHKGGCTFNAGVKANTAGPGSQQAHHHEIKQGSDDSTQLHVQVHANGTCGMASAEDRQPLAQHSDANVAGVQTMQRGSKRCWSSPLGPSTAPMVAAPNANGHTQHPDSPLKAAHGDQQHSVISKVAPHVTLRWQHIEPIAMHLFDSYREISQEACIGAREQRFDATPTHQADACIELHGNAGGCGGLKSQPQSQRGTLARLGGGSSSHDTMCSLGGAGRKGRQVVQLQPWLEAISGDLQAVSRFRSLDVVSVVQPALEARVTQPSRRMVSAVALDRADQIMAVVGISKPVRLYRFSDLCCESRGAAYAHYPIAELNVRTKPTSACFNPYLQHRLVVSDAEGGVMIMDTSTQHDVMQLEEHGSRVWAVDSSPHDPALLLSASTDRTVRLWRANSENSVGVIAEANQVCSAVFCPTDANLLALGTSSFARLYDIRRLDSPLGSVTAPKAVSYVRFMGKHLIAASVDSVLCMYDTEQVANAAGVRSVQPVREFRGHLNTRNFVGLACSQEGYMFTGSENSSVVMYHRSVPAPVAEQPVVSCDAMGGGGGPEATVSCVAATAALDYVVTGSTTGWVNVMKLKS